MDFPLEKDQLLLQLAEKKTNPKVLKLEKRKTELAKNSLE